MSGIPTSGGGGDVKLDGDPNTFVGKNTFNVNRPTSTLTSAPAATDLITKQNADALYTNNTGDAVLAGANAFTSTNTFNNNRPTSSLTNTPAANEFITKRDAENEFAILGAGTSGSPQEFIGFTNFEENLGINGENLNLTNGTRRVIDMATNPPTNSNKLIMEAPTTEITMTSGGSKNQLSQVASSSAINAFLQTGTASTINLISQVGVNSTITTDGKFTTATAPSGVNDLCNKAYVDLLSQNVTWRVYELGNGNVNTVFPQFNGLDFSVSPYTGAGGDHPVIVASPFRGFYFVRVAGYYLLEWNAYNYLTSTSTSSRPAIYKNAGTTPVSVKGGRVGFTGNSISTIMALDTDDVINVKAESGRLYYSTFGIAGQYNQFFGTRLHGL